MWAGVFLRVLLPLKDYKLLKASEKVCGFGSAMFFHSGIGVNSVLWLRAAAGKQLLRARSCLLLQRAFTQNGHSATVVSVLLWPRCVETKRLAKLRISMSKKLTCAPTHPPVVWIVCKHCWSHVLWKAVILKLTQHFCGEVIQCHAQVFILINLATFSRITTTKLSGKYTHPPHHFWPIFKYSSGCKSFRVCFYQLCTSTARGWSLPKKDLRQRYHGPVL